MNQTEKAISAILSTFPTAESFASFYQTSDNSEICDSFISFAVRNGIIDSPDMESLEQFLRTHADTAAKFRVPENIHFEELLNRKKESLNLNLSLRALCNRINTILTSHQIALPHVTNSMLIRLKKEPLDTPHKLNVLRSIAFWLGYERADIAKKWNYDALIKLFPENRRSHKYSEYNEGVRIGFSLTSRGEVIDHEIIGWLKKTIKNYIHEEIGHFLYGKWGKVKAYDITTLYVDFPKEKEGGNLEHYRQCLWSAVRLAHQVAVCWALSKYASNSRFLSMAIVSGDYATLDKHLLPILNAKLPDDPVIRLSDYARHGLLINDIRVILCQKPAETGLYSGESLPIWWITSLWTTHYFDFVSDLLHDETLDNSPASIEKLNQLLWPMEDADSSSSKMTEENAITTFFKYPHNSMLGVEIAKTLYYRKRYSEAAEILRIVLSINPKDLVARTLRMMVLRSMAIDTPSHRTAAAVYRQARQEADNVLEYCDCRTEDFYCEYAIVFMTEALSTVRYTRAHPEAVADAREFRKIKHAVFKALDQAKHLFEKGISISSSATRSSYLLKSAIMVQAILRSDDELFINPDKPLAAALEVGQQDSMDVQWQVGLRRAELPVQKQDELVVKLTIQKGAIHDVSSGLFSYRPTTQFCNAVVLWDFFTVHTVQTAKLVREKLETAIDVARRAQQENVCIYSFTRSYGEMVTAQEYIEHMQRALKMIDEEVGGDLSGREDSEIIVGPARDKPPKLFTLNF